MSNVIMSHFITDYWDLLNYSSYRELPKLALNGMLQMSHGDKSHFKYRLRTRKATKSRPIDLCTIYM